MPDADDALTDLSARLHALEQRTLRAVAAAEAAEAATRSNTQRAAALTEAAQPLLQEVLCLEACVSTALLDAAESDGVYQAAQARHRAIDVVRTAIGFAKVKKPKSVIRAKLPSAPPEAYSPFSI